MYSDTCRYCYLVLARNICVVKFRVRDYVVFDVNPNWRSTLLMKLLLIPFVVIEKNFGPPSPSIKKVARKALVFEKCHDLV
jgi:hypothetical protein